MTSWALTVFLGFGYITVPGIASESDCRKLYEKMRGGLYVRTKEYDEGKAPRGECHSYRSRR